MMNILLLKKKIDISKEEVTKELKKIFFFTIE